MRSGDRFAARLGMALVVALAAGGAPRIARAADPPPAQASAATSDEARADAEKRLREGLDRYQRGDYDGARVAFAQAYAVLSSIDLLHNLARAEVKSGHALEAIVHLRQLLRDPRATDEDRAKANRVLAEANAMTGHIAIDAPAGTEVVIDAIPSGECPFSDPLEVPPGKHVVEARVSGGGPQRIEVTASAGDVVTARFVASAENHAPTVSAPVPMAAPGRDQEGPAHDRAESPSRTSKARVIVPVVLGSAAVVAVGVGIAFGLASSGHQSDAEDFRASHATGFCADRSSGACTQYQSILDSQQQATNIERVALVAGGVLAVGAVATYALWPRARIEAKGAWIAPVPAGVRAGFSF